MKQEDNNDGRTVVNHIYGFQFNGCNITNPTFQTLVQGGASGGRVAVPEPSGAASDRERASVAEPVAASESVSEPVPALPEALLTDEACRLRERLSKAGRRASWTRGGSPWVSRMLKKGCWPRCWPTDWASETCGRRSARFGA